MTCNSAALDELESGRLIRRVSGKLFARDTQLDLMIAKVGRKDGAHHMSAAAAVAAEKRCAATQMQQGSSVHVVSREVEPEQSVPTAQITAEMIDDEKVETKTENKETVTEEKAIQTQVSAEKLIDVSVEKNMEDDVSENRREDQRIEIGSQRGGALQSGGSRMQKALSRIGKMIEHSTGE
jgi:hypothetical protein